ncbi:MAG: sugar ABC transporter ATP-binding protein [Actinomycetota bacterium]
MRAEALRFENVSKTFGDIRVLHDVTLGLEQGAVCCLLGHNGSGKSTFIKVLAGFHEADPGARVIEDGIPAVPLTAETSAPWRNRLKFIHQDLGLVDNLGVLDNLALGRGFSTGRFGRILWHVERARAVVYFNRLGLHLDLNQPVRDLSAVERTAVAVVRALLDLDEDRGVLVLDEPTASLSAPEAEQLYDIVRRLTAGGVAVLLVTHRLSEVEALADHVVVLRDGRVVVDTAGRELSQSQLLEYITGEPMEYAEPIGSNTTIRADAPEVLRIAELCGSSLSEFHLTLHAGEIVGVAGLNGSGRDELAGLIFGVVESEGCRIEVNGQVLARNSPRASIRSGMALVPANRARYGLVRGHTVRENASLTQLSALSKRGLINPRRERSEAIRWMSAVDLPATYLEHHIEQLSGGSQQKVVLAKWLRREPQVLLLDEPTQGVDVAAKRSIHRRITRAAAEGAAVLMCSSDNEELAELASRVLVLRDGHVSAELQGDALTDKALTEAMLQTEGKYVNQD